MAEVPPGEIEKRDGTVEGFRPEKVEAAARKALEATDSGGVEDARDVAAEVRDRLARTHGDEGRPRVEEIQDLVERALMDLGFPRAAKAFILYRQEHADLRRGKEIVGVRDDLQLTLNAVTVLERRYLKKDETGRVVETPGEMFERVARAVASAEEEWREPDEVAATAERFEEAMRSLRFLPNSPTLMNAGTRLGQLAACFVLPVPDSMEGIFDALKSMALIHQSGGGTGFAFSRIRPRDDIVRSTGGRASGPLSFLSIFDAATDVIVQGGRRRGANMGILRVDHPDVAEFVTAKTDGSFRNFNLSVAVTDAFMEAVEEGGDQPLVNPRTGEEVGRIPARDLFDLIATMAWQTGDPGLVFLDEIDRRHPLPGAIEATNPCGEVPLLPWEACNLGSINLARMVRDGELDRDLLRETARLATHFLDDVISVSRYPLPAIGKAVRRTRKIGLGVMGFAEMLIRMGIPYEDERTLDLGREIMSTIAREARLASRELAAERGPFPAFEESRWAEDGGEPIRNATLTSIAPTGTISIIAGTTSGIEPLYSVAHVRTALGGEDLLEVAPTFRTSLEERGLDARRIIQEALRRGSVQGIEELPDDLKELYACAHDVDPEWHVRVQAAFQREVDNAVSKTINLRRDASIGAVRRAYRLAWELDCKGITIYRSGSKADQVLHAADRRADRPEDTPADPTRADRVVRVGAEFTEDCKVCE